MTGDRDGLTELISIRVREEHLTHNLSEAVYLLHCVLLWIAIQPESEARSCALALIRAKFHQMPQGSALGQMITNVDKQFGNPLESNGVNIERWVFEPRGRRYE
jgi:hypothetical protein